jgi:hypothetical protein
VVVGVGVVGGGGRALQAPAVWRGAVGAGAGGVGEWRRRAWSRAAGPAVPSDPTPQHPHQRHHPHPTPPPPHPPTHHPRRYQDEVRRVTKECYEEVWNMLEEHRWAEGVWAGGWPSLTGPGRLPAGLPACQPACRPGPGCRPAQPMAGGATAAPRSPRSTATTPRIRHPRPRPHAHTPTPRRRRRDALWAGVRELSSQKEMLGSELRDVFDAHPPQPLAAPKELSMRLFTRGKGDRWGPGPRRGRGGAAAGGAWAAAGARPCCARLGARACLWQPGAP